MSLDQPSRTRPATKVVQSTARGWLLRLVGWPAIGLGLMIAVLAQSGFSSDEAPPLPGWDSPLRPIIYGVLGGFLLVLGHLLVRRARRHLAAVLHSLAELPAGQKVVLFLRSFEDDGGFARQQRGNQVIDFAGTTRTEEEQLRRALAPFGRMVALGRPGDELPQAGADRHYSSDEDWRDQVLAGLDRAGLVVLATGPGPGLRWEVDQLVARDQPERLIILVSRDAQQYQSFRTSMGDRFPKGLPDYEPRSPLRPIAAAIYTRAAIWFDADWTPHLRHLDGRDAEGDVGNWVESTFPRVMAPVYLRAGVAAPGRFLDRLGRRTRAWPAESMPAPRVVTESAEGTWRAERVRTGGVFQIVRVSDGTETHTVEYRAYSRNRAVVLCDGKRVGRGCRCLDREFPLGRRGPTARLAVTDDPDLRLWVAGREVYGFRRAAAGSDSVLEHKAAVVRSALLAGETPFSGPFRTTLRVAPDLSRRDARTVRATSTDPVIGLLTTRSDYGVAHTWLTDRAVHIRYRAHTTVIPYGELEFVPVTADYLTLQACGTYHLPGHAENVAKLIDRVSTAVRLAEPPPIHRFPRPGDARATLIREACRPIIGMIWRALWLPLAVVGALAAGVDGDGFGPWPWPARVAAGAVGGAGVTAVLVLVLASAVLVARGCARLVAAPRRRRFPTPANA